MEFQTRSEETGLGRFSTFAEAMSHASNDPSVWKISFSLPTGERVRLVKRMGGGYVVEPIDCD